MVARRQHFCDVNTRWRIICHPTNGQPLRGESDTDPDTNARYLQIERRKCSVRRAPACLSTSPTSEGSVVPPEALSVRQARRVSAR